MKISKLDNLNNLNKLKISLLYNKQIELLSNGLIKNSKTLDYTNLKSIENGLFCSKIFGNLKNEKCVCDKFLNSNNLNLLCDTCNIETNSSYFRRIRFGHINLNGFFINNLFFNKRPYYLSLILNISLKNINNVLYNDFYLILFSNINKLKFGNIISIKEYKFYSYKYKNNFYADTGFSAIYKYLKTFDLKKEYFFLKNFFKKNYKSIEIYNKNLKRYKLFKYLYKLNINITNLILNKLLVLPPDLRPIVKLSDDSIVSSDLNELYKIVINRNNRLKKFIKYNLPENLIKDCHNLVQDSINNLFENNNNSDLKSISDNVKGKLGIFRQNLLGKRVDYSGRAVIVSGPFLKLNECCIPVAMATELFRPFLYNYLIYKKKFDINKSKQYVDSNNKIIFNILKKIIKDKFVLLNRAPTLHRLGMQSFKPILTKDNVIKLHPLVCSSFNADFDGDQMAVHIPITSKTNVEYKMILSSLNNVLNSSNSECSIVPTQDIILGLYYCTKIFNYNFKNYYFENFNDLYNSYIFNKINLNTRIFYRFKNFNDNCFYYNIFETTIGRVILYNFLPKNISFNYINRTLNKKDISLILLFLYENFGSLTVIKFSDNLMRLGFFSSTHSGLSISIDDMNDNYEKKYIIEKSLNLCNYYNIEYLNGLLSYNNRYRKIINLWELTCDLISNISIKNLFYSNKNDINSLSYIIDSGSRGSEMQIRQICGLRGLMFYKNFGLLEIPVFSSLKEGLKPLEFFYFSHNSRKTLSDTALKTSSSGYLTRKLVEACNNIIITEIDCKCNDGIILKNLVNNGELLESFFERILGRVIIEDVYDKSNNNLLLFKNTLIENFHLNILKKFDINFLKIRSPITCLSENGICSYCYGFDLSKKSLVNVGEVVGIIAAQSIGEPGTQLTMRTFHSGGAYISKSIISRYYSNNNGYIKFSNSLKFVINEFNLKIIISNNSKIKIVNIYNEDLEIFRLPYGSIIYVENNDLINIGDLICKWDPYYNIYLSEFNGYITFENFFENINYVKRFDNTSGLYNYEILKNNILKPILNIFYDNKEKISFKLEYDYLIMFNDNDKIKKGDIVFKYHLNIDNSYDITGGLPRINDLFEARFNKNYAILSMIDGFVSIKCLKNKYIINIQNLSGNRIKYSIPLHKNILVKDKDYINKGDLIVNGLFNPHEILKLYGLNGIFDYYSSEIKSIYYSQGVKMNDKHIEIVIKQMLNKILIKNNYKNIFFSKDLIYKSKLNKFIKKNYSFNLLKIDYENILSGITKSSLDSEYFLSSASFQETTSILVKSSLINKKNKIKSLKDNIMLGNIIPAGTGFYSKKIF